MGSESMIAGVNVGEPEVPELMELLKKGNNGERAEAAKQLGAKKAVEAVSPLVKRLTGNGSEKKMDPSKDVRCAAARALGQIGISDVVLPLVAALYDREWVVRDTAAEALAGMGERILPALREAEKSGKWKVGLVIKRIEEASADARMMASLHAQGEEIMYTGQWGGTNRKGKWRAKVTSVQEPVSPANSGRSPK